MARIEMLIIGESLTEFKAELTKAAKEFGIFSADCADFKEVAQAQSAEKIIISEEDAEATTTETETPETDALGIPYDGRIHTSSKTNKIHKTGKKKGQWIYRKNLQADYIEKIEAEIRPNYEPSLKTESVSNHVLKPDNFKDFLDGMANQKAAECLSNGFVTEANTVSFPAEKTKEYEMCSKSSIYLNSELVKYTGVEGSTIRFRLEEPPVSEASPSDEIVTGFAPFMKYCLDHDIKSEEVDSVCELLGITNGRAGLQVNPALVPFTHYIIVNKIDHKEVNDVCLEFGIENGLLGQPEMIDFVFEALKARL